MDLVTLIVLILAVGALIWAISRIPPPWQVLCIVAVAIIALVVIVSIVGGLGPLHSWHWRH
jgi:membrane protein YdbS with pleckstrin-like domain